MTPSVAARALRAAACASLVVFSACDRASAGGVSAPTVPSAAALATEALTLPTSSSTAPAPGDALLLVLSRKGLSLGSDGATLVAPDVDTAAWSKGFEAKYKQGSRNDYYLVPLGSALRAAYPGDASVPAVSIAADPSMTYRLLTETLYTLGQERVKTVALLVRSPAGKAAVALALPGRFGVTSPLSEEARRTILQAVARRDLDASATLVPPPLSPPSASALPTGPKTLSLNVIVTTRGFIVSAAGRRIAPGCHEDGAGTAVPRRDDGYDFVALTACATVIKSSGPRFASETHVTVTADAGVDVQTVVSTIDALRGPEGSLFPEVALGVPK